MILTAHQPVYLPWLGLFHKIMLADKFVFFDAVQYVPRDWNNRNYVKSSTGPILLTLPVLSKGHRNTVINQIRINSEVDWRKKHWKTICSCYSRARFFKKYAPVFEHFYYQEWTYLADLNYEMLLLLFNILEIKVPVIRAKNYNFIGSKSELVLDMCKKLGASKYIFGRMGQSYACEESFARNKIELIFQEYKHPIYRQLYGKFIANMSVLDLLFNEGRNSLNKIMYGNLQHSRLTGEKDD